MMSNTIHGMHSMSEMKESKEGEQERNKEMGTECDLQETPSELGEADNMNGVPRSRRYWACSGLDMKQVYLLIH